MQCQGKTRNGRRCRNRSLEGELFCDIHMRVNHTRNFTLFLPALITLLSIYFLLIGLFFQVSVFDVFDISFLEFAGLEDILLSAVKFAAVMALLLLSIWIAYSLLLSLIFSVILLISSLRSDEFKKLSPRARIKAILISLYVLGCNIILRLVLIIPRRGRIKGKKIILRRNRFSRAFINLYNSDGQLRSGRPFKRAKEAFSRYLFFREMGDHKFASFSLLLFLLTTGIIAHVMGHAHGLRTCTASTLTTQSTALPGYHLGPACNNSGGNFFAAKPLHMISDMLFPASLVAFAGSENPIPTLHLGSTSRFDLFFDLGATRPLILPRGIEFLNLSDKSLELPPSLQKGIHNLQNYMITSLKHFGRYFEKTEAALTDIRREISALKTSVQVISRKQSTAAHSQPADRMLSCLRSAVVLRIPFAFNSTAIEQVQDLSKLRNLARKLTKSAALDIVITGYSDASGPLSINHHISKQRADKVAQILHRLQIPPQRIFAMGMGVSTQGHPPERRADIRLCPA